MQKSPLQLTPLLAERLAFFKRRARRLTALLWLWVAIATCVGFLLLSTAADYFIGPSDGWRLLLSGSGYLLFALVLGVGTWRSWRAISTQKQAAREFETRSKGVLQEKLISAVQLVEEAGHGQPDSALTEWMKLQVLQQAEQAVGPISMEALLPSRKVKQIFIPAFVLTSLVGILLFWETPRIFLARAFFPLAKIERPTTSDFAVTPGDQSIDVGSDFVITASPHRLRSNMRAVILWNDGVKEVVPLTQLDTNRFSATINRVAKPFRYLVQAGGLKSPHFAVQLRMPPRLQNLTLWNQPLPYLGAEALKLGPENAKMVSGGKIRVEAKHDGSRNEVVRLTFEGISTNTSEILPGEHFSAWFTPTQNFAFHAELIQSNKVMETTQPFQVAVIPDSAPSIAWRTNASKRFFNAGDSIILEGSAFDDVALADGRLILRAESGDQVTNIVFNTFTPGGRVNIATQADFNVTIPLKLLRVNQGESFSVRAEIRDLAGNMTNSEVLSSIVVSEGSAEMAALIQKLRGILAALKTSHTRLDDLNQAWIAASQNAGAGAQGYEAELVVWEARARTVCAALAAEGEETFNAARTANGFYGGIIDQLGHALSGWADAQDGILSHAVKVSLEKNARVEKELTKGRAYLGSALSEIVQYEDDFVLVINSLEAEVLKSMALSAQERYRPVLRNITGLEGWTGKIPLPGFLHADFYAGTNTSAAPSYSNNEVPELLNYKVPGLGKTNWVAEFKGELYLPEAGNWWLRGIANDGAEISVDGERLDDLTKQFSLKGDFVLKFKSVAGWHPFKIKLRQNLAESRLNLKISSDTELFTSIPSDWLRTSQIETNAFAQQMSLLSSRDPKMLLQSVKELVSHLLPYPTNVSRIATETEIPKIAFFAFRCNQDARDIREALLSKSLKPVERKILEIRADEMVGTIIETHKTLLEHLRNLEYRLPKTATQTQWEQLLSARLRTLLRVLRRNGNSWEISESQRQENIQKEIATIQEWYRLFATGEDQTMEYFRENATTEDTTFGEKLQSIAAWSEFSYQYLPMISGISRRLQAGEAPAKIADDLDRRINEIVTSAERLRKPEITHQQLQLAAQADEIVTVLQARRDTNMVAGFSHVSLENAFSNVLSNAKTLGLYRTVQDLEETRSETSFLGGNKQLEDKLRNIANPNISEESVGKLLADSVGEEAKTLGTVSKSRTTKNLNLPLIAMVLESEKANARGEKKKSEGYLVLHRDLENLTANADQMTKPALEEIKRRALALLNENTRQPIQLNPPPSTNKLERLAEMAGKAETNKTVKAELISELEKLSAEAPPLEPQDEKNKEDAKKLLDSLRETKNADQDLQKERARLAEKQQAIIDEASRLQMELQGEKNLDPYLNRLNQNKTAMKQVKEALQNNGAAKKGSPAPADKAKAISQDVQKTISEPLAKSQLSGNQKDPASSKLGESAANIAARQKELADELAKLQQAEEENAQQLAEAFKEAAEDLPPEDEAKAPTMAEKALAKIHQAQTVANAAQRQANALRSEAARIEASGSQEKSRTALDNFRNAEKLALTAQTEALNIERAEMLPLLGESDPQQLSSLHEELTQAVGNSSAALTKLEKVSDVEPQQTTAMQNQSDARELLAETALAMKATAEALAKQTEDAPGKPQPSEKSPPSPGNAPSAAKSALKSLKSGKEGAQQAKSTLSKAARDQRLSKALKGSPSKSRQQQKTSTETKKSGTFEGEGGRGSGAIPANNEKWADWSKLPEQIRKAYSAGELEMFSPDQRELIKNYFEKLESQP